MLRLGVLALTFMPVIAYADGPDNEPDCPPVSVFLDEIHEVDPNVTRDMTDGLWEDNEDFCMERGVPWSELNGFTDEELTRLIFNGSGPKGQPHYPGFTEPPPAPIPLGGTMPMLLIGLFGLFGIFTYRNWRWARALTRP